MKPIDFLRCHLSRWRREYKEQSDTGGKIIVAWIIILVPAGVVYGLYKFIVAYGWIGISYMIGIPIVLFILWLIGWRFSSLIDRWTKS